MGCCPSWGERQASSLLRRRQFLSPELLVQKHLAARFALHIARTSASDPHIRCAHWRVPCACSWHSVASRPRLCADVVCGCVLSERGGSLMWAIPTREASSSFQPASVQCQYCSLCSPNTQRRYESGGTVLRTCLRNKGLVVVGQLYKVAKTKYLKSCMLCSVEGVP